MSNLGNNPPKIHENDNSWTTEWTSRTIAGDKKLGGVPDFLEELRQESHGPDFEDFSSFDNSNEDADESEYHFGTEFDTNDFLSHGQNMDSIFKSENNGWEVKPGDLLLDVKGNDPGVGGRGTNQRDRPNTGLKILPPVGVSLKGQDSIPVGVSGAESLITALKEVEKGESKENQTTKPIPLEDAAKRQTVNSSYASLHEIDSEIESLISVLQAMQASPSDTETKVQPSAVQSSNAADGREPPSTEIGPELATNRKDRDALSPERNVRDSNEAEVKQTHTVPTNSVKNIASNQPGASMQQLVKGLVTNVQSLLQAKTGNPQPVKGSWALTLNASNLETGDDKEANSMVLRYDNRAQDQEDWSLEYHKAKAGDHSRSKEKVTASSTAEIKELESDNSAVIQRHASREAPKETQIVVKDKRKTKQKKTAAKKQKQDKKKKKKTVGPKTKQKKTAKKDKQKPAQLKPAVLKTSGGWSVSQRKGVTAKPESPRVKHKKVSKTVVSTGGGWSVFKTGQTQGNQLNPGDVSLTMESGKVWAALEANNTGKSTDIPLLKISTAPGLTRNDSTFRPAIAISVPFTTQSVPNEALLAAAALSSLSVDNMFNNSDVNARLLADSNEENGNSNMLEDEKEQIDRDLKTGDAVEVKTNHTNLTVKALEGSLLQDKNGNETSKDVENLEKVLETIRKAGLDMPKAVQMDKWNHRVMKPEAHRKKTQIKELAKQSIKSAKKKTTKIKEKMKVRKRVPGEVPSEDRKPHSQKEKVKMLPPAPPTQESSKSETQSVQLQAPAAESVLQPSEIDGNQTGEISNPETFAETPKDRAPGDTEDMQQTSESAQETPNDEASETTEQIVVDAVLDDSEETSEEGTSKVSGKKKQNKTVSEQTMQASLHESLQNAMSGIVQVFNEEMEGHPPATVEKGNLPDNKTETDDKVDGDVLVSAVDSGVMWTPWSDWGACSVSCGRGWITRRRFCLTVTRKCEGRAIEMQFCHAKPCPGKTILARNNPIKCYEFSL